jgi:hypothetical protein
MPRLRLSLLTLTIVQHSKKISVQKPKYIYCYELIYLCPFNHFEEYMLVI